MKTIITKINENKNIYLLQYIVTYKNHLQVKLFFSYYPVTNKTNSKISLLFYIKRIGMQVFLVFFILIMAMPFNLT